MFKKTNKKKSMPVLSLGVLVGISRAISLSIITIFHRNPQLQARRAADDSEDIRECLLLSRRVLWGGRLTSSRDVGRCRMDRIDV